MELEEARTRLESCAGEAAAGAGAAEEAARMRGELEAVRSEAAAAEAEAGRLREEVSAARAAAGELAREKEQVGA